MCMKYNILIKPPIIRRLLLVTTACLKRLHHKKHPFENIKIDRDIVQKNLT